MPADREKRFLVIYSGVLTAVFAGTVFWGCASMTRKPRFDEIDVQRINIIEPDGTVRLVVANKARFPGSFFGNKEIPRTDRQTAGLLFVNDDGNMGYKKKKDGQIAAAVTRLECDQDKSASVGVRRGASGGGDLRRRTPVRLLAVPKPVAAAGRDRRRRGKSSNPAIIPAAAGRGQVGTSAHEGHCRP
jgi:hypothetical protein